MNPNEAAIQELQQVIATTSDFQAVDDQEQTLLHQAASLGYLEGMKILLDKGVPINARDYEGETALHLAVQGDHKEGVQLLLDRKAAVNIKNYAYETACNIAIASDKLVIIDVFLDKNIDCYAVGSLQETMLGIAVINAEDDVTVKYLLDKGVDPNALSGDSTPLYKAVRLGKSEVIRTLLERGADIRSAHIHKFLKEVQAPHLDSRYYDYDTIYDAWPDEESEPDETSLPNWNKTKPTIDDLICFILHGWSIKESDMHALERMLNIDFSFLRNQDQLKIAVEKARANAYKSLAHVLDQLAIKADQDDYPEIFCFLSQAPYFRYHQQTQKTLKEYFTWSAQMFLASNEEGFDDETDFSLDIYRGLRKKGIPNELIYPMLEPIFERQTHIVELFESFDLSKEIIGKLYHELLKEDSPLHAFLVARAEHDWLESAWEFKSMDTPTIRP